MALAVLQGIKMKAQMRGLRAFYREGKMITWSEAVVEVKVCVDVEQHHPVHCLQSYLSNHPTTLPTHPQVGIEQEACFLFFPLLFPIFYSYLFVRFYFKLKSS